MPSEQEAITEQINALQERLKELDPVKHMSARELAEASGVPAATAHRFKTGKTVTMEVAKKMLPFITTCPCCGKST